jgi:hypothetical protein
MVAADLGQVAFGGLAGDGALEGVKEGGEVHRA